MKLIRNKEFFYFDFMFGFFFFRTTKIHTYIHRHSPEIQQIKTTIRKEVRKNLLFHNRLNRIFSFSFFLHYVVELDCCVKGFPLVVLANEINPFIIGYR